MIWGLHFGVWWDLARYQEGPRGSQSWKDSGAQRGRLLSDEKERNSVGPPLPLGHCFPALRALVGAWEAVRSPPPSGGSGSLRSERAALFLCCRDFSQCAGACMRGCSRNPVGPGLRGPPARCMQVSRCPWRRTGQLGGPLSRRPLPPLPHLSLTPACPSRPESNSSCSATRSGVSPAPPDLPEPTRHFLQQIAGCRFRSVNNAAADHL